MRVFRDRYPDVQLTMNECCTNKQVAALQNHQVDIGFLYLPLDEKWLTLKPIAEETWIVALPKRHPLADQNHLVLSALAQEAFILHPRQEGPAFYNQIIGLREQAGFRPKVLKNSLKTLIKNR